MKSQSALARRIDREDEERRQAQWAERAVPTRRRTKWAIDHLLDTGQITSEQHDAAAQYAITKAIALKPPHLGQSNVTTIHPGWDLTVAAELNRIAHACGRGQAAETIVAARAWVVAAPLTTKYRLALMDRLFAFPQPSWKAIYTRDRQNSAARVSALLDVLVAFWAARETQSEEIGGLVR